VCGLNFSYKVDRFVVFGRNIDALKPECNFKTTLSSFSINEEGTWPLCVDVDVMTLRSSKKKIQFDLNSLPAANSRYKLYMTDALTPTVYDLVGILGSRLISIDIEIYCPYRCEIKEPHQFAIHTILEACPELASLSLEVPDTIDRTSIGQLSAKHFENLNELIYSHVLLNIFSIFYRSSVSE
jgi:hypothetical protein